MNKDLDVALSWLQIACPQFESLLWHNTKTGVYESGGKFIFKDDKRLIEYLEMQKDLKPVNNPYLIKNK